MGSQVSSTVPDTQSTLPQSLEGGGVEAGEGAGKWVIDGGGNATHEFISLSCTTKFNSDFRYS